MATFQDDDELVITVDANSTYEVTAFILASAPTTEPDIKYNFNETDGEFYVLSHGSATNAGSANNGNGQSPSSSGALALVGADIKHIIVFQGIIVTGVSGGPIAFEWAQINSSASAVSVHANSWLRAVKLA